MDPCKEFVPALCWCTQLLVLNPLQIWVTLTDLDNHYFRLIKDCVMFPSQMLVLLLWWLAVLLWRVFGFGLSQNAPELLTDF